MLTGAQGVDGQPTTIFAQMCPESAASCLKALEREIEDAAIAAQHYQRKLDKLRAQYDLITCRLSAVDQAS